METYASHCTLLRNKKKKKKKKKKKREKKIQLKKKSKIIFFWLPYFVFDQNLLIPLVFQINILHKLYCYVHYAMAYYYKKFQNFSIKILTIIACPNFKNWLWAFRS